MEHPDAPPPPYSETDIYSTPGNTPLTSSGSNNHADNASIAASSSHSNIIYTPPDTPRDSHYDFASTDDVQTTASAQVYFDSRPISGPPGNTANVVHEIRVSDDPSPGDFPYPNWASARDVTLGDWRTFINYLIPDYAEKTNAAIIDRKLQAEDDARSTASTRAATEAQLDQLRTSSQRRRFEDTVREWNVGFFAPRGATIKLTSDSAAEPKARMPGEWNSTFDSNASRDAPMAGQQPEQRGGWRGLFGNRFGMNIHDRGLQVGPISIDGDRVAIGNAFEVDSRGVRWHGRDVNDSFHGGHGRGHGRECHDHGRGRGGGRHDIHDHRHGGRGGGKHRSRSSSCSTTSSSSSDSTVSSVGSLPDWDDLRDSQIPVARTSVQAWLSHPDQPVSKADVKRVRAEIKAAKSLPKPAAGITKVDKEEIKVLLEQFKSLKKTQRATLRAAKKERKAERRAQRRARRSRSRAERKEGRRQRREMGRAEREGERQQQNGGDFPQSSFAPSHGPVPVPGMPHIPPVPPMPVMAPVPPVPPMPGHGPDAFFGPGRSGMPGFFGGFGNGRGSHFGPFSGFGSGRRNKNAYAAAYEQAVGAPARADAARTREAALEQAAKAREQAALTRELALEEAARKREAAFAQAARDREEAAMKREAALAQAARAREDAARKRDIALEEAARKREAAHAQAQEQAARSRGESSRRREGAAALRAAAWASAAEVRAEAWKHANAAHARAWGGEPAGPSGSGTGSGQGQQARETQQGSAAKYQAAEQLEAQIHTKRVTLQALQQEVQAEGIAAAQAGLGDAKKSGPSQAQLDAETLEGEIDALSAQVERLRIEADGEFAAESERDSAKYA
ncbi:uncharacterized protein JN550_001973 [Neoarthrinium moseri]|uniref:uncharacterized protein n=1 Tax=Neoarthrinium moseri TaxID=1658444 RepID=UPI001FDDCDA8|nr:uncharacterized protein JN550_001973 [Neoarthrinium moseri]KAI1875687.1 hypothetical protein JN550_001973 [Neoarthrinium moseri]